MENTDESKTPAIIVFRWKGRVWVFSGRCPHDAFTRAAKDLGGKYVRSKAKLRWSRDIDAFIRVNYREGARGYPYQNVGGKTAEEIAAILRHAYKLHYTKNSVISRYNNVIKPRLRQCRTTSSGK